MQVFPSGGHLAAVGSSYVALIKSKLELNIFQPNFQSLNFDCNIIKNFLDGYLFGIFSAYINKMISNSNARCGRGIGHLSQIPGQQYYVMTAVRQQSLAN